MRATVFTYGIPQYLKDENLLGTRPWKVSKSTLSLKGQRSTFRLKFKKKSMRTLEPWQRVGFWLWVEVSVCIPAAAKILGISPKSTILVGHLAAPPSANGSAWHTHETTHEGLAQAIGERLAPIVDTFADAVDHPLAYESTAWKALSPWVDEAELPWAKPVEHLATTPISVSVAASSTFGRTLHYAAALLLRRETAAAETLIGHCGPTALEQATNLPSDDVVMWDSVRAELESQKALALDPVPLVSTHFGLKAAHEIAKRDATEALLDAPSQPQKETHPDALLATEDDGTVWGGLKALANPPTRRLDSIERSFHWRAFCDGIAGLTDDEQQALPEYSDDLSAALEAIPAHALTTNYDWHKVAHAQKTPPLEWRFARALQPLPLALAGEFTRQFAHLRLSHPKSTTILQEHELPEVLSADFWFESFDATLAELLVTRSPKLESLTAQIDDACLGTIAKTDWASQLKALRTRASTPADKGVKALARRKDLSLKSLSFPEVKAPALKSLLKATWLGGLESLTVGRTSPGGLRDLLPALPAQLSGLRSLSIGTQIDVTNAVFPPCLQDLNVRPQGDFSGCVRANPALQLRRLELELDTAAAEALAEWSVRSSVEELKFKVHEREPGDYERTFSALASVEWPKLRSIELQLYSAADDACDALADWFERCPQLRDLVVRTSNDNITVIGAETLLTAVPSLTRFEANIPVMLEAISRTPLPNLVALDLVLRASNPELKIPITRTHLEALQDMPRLRAVRTEAANCADGVEVLADTLLTKKKLLSLSLG